MLPLTNCVLRRPLHRMIDPAYLNIGSQTGIRDFAFDRFIHWLEQPCDQTMGTENAGLTWQDRRRGA